MLWREMKQDRVKQEICCDFPVNTFEPFILVDQAKITDERLPQTSLQSPMSFNV